MKTNKKMRHIIFPLIALVAILCISLIWKKVSEDHGYKNIELTIKVEEEVIFSETVQTNEGNLANLLKELEEKNIIQIEYSNSVYGMYIQGLGNTDNIYFEEPKQSKYWTYDSPNNAQCSKNGFCDAADSLLINDGDSFVFSLANIE